jgi:hypothetical protein
MDGVDVEGGDDWELVTATVGAKNNFGVESK